MNKINIKETLAMTGVPGTVLKSELVVFAEECTVSFTGITGNAHTVTYTKRLMSFTERGYNKL